MRKPGLTAVGFGLIGIGSSLFASPAMAAIDCGTAPTGGTLTQAGDYCQLVFSTPGDYSFTVPTSSNQLFALVVGAGAGAYTDGFSGYAGNAGKVTYKDMSSGIGAPINVHVGLAGTSGTDAAATAGGDTNAADSFGHAAVAFGGAAGAYSDYYCNYDGFSGAVIQNGLGARTAPDFSVDRNCTHVGLGVRPDQSDRDSNGVATPAIFSDITDWFGYGGFIGVQPFAINAGQGATISIGGDPIALGTLGNAGDGRAIFRWRHVTVLSNTGSNAGDLSALAISLMTLGVGLTVASRVRRRVSK